MLSSIQHRGISSGQYCTDDDCQCHFWPVNSGPYFVPPPPQPKPTGLPTEDAARKRLKLWTYLMEYFPDSFLAEAEVAIRGNEQHNPGEPLHWARDKSTDQLNTAFRHMFDYGRGVKRDTDGQYHLAKAIWRLKAQLQLDIEAERKASER